MVDGHNGRGKGMMFTKRAVSRAGVSRGLV